MILIDIAEPAEICNLIKQTVPITIAPLNQASMADYRLSGFDGHSIQVNRTQAGELLSNIDSFEDELRRYYKSADEFYAVIEGIISPYKLSAIRSPQDISLRPLAPPGSLYTYAISDRGYIYDERVYNVSNKMFKAWLYQIDKAGITVMYTINYVDTAACLVALHENAQKAEHSTLQRYYKPKIRIKPHNPHVVALMALSSAYQLDVGQKKAEALIDYFGTVFNVLIASSGDLQEVEGIGPTIAKKIVNSIQGGED